MTRLSLPLLLALATLHGIVASVDAAAILRNRAQDDDGAHFRDAFWSPEPASPPGSGPPSSAEPGPSGKGKGKATETPAEALVDGAASDATVRKYEVTGRKVYNAWLMADTTAAAQKIMSQPDAQGPDPAFKNWARPVPIEQTVTDAC
ncbi:hypothetical protein Slin15195_G108460 [Septoria linicola]|uniref:Uncharacterized protein n=1 Tax=Septoria linicola TaxID=215465 RepID=A0A9Q9EPB5_9PEZI|nr:hypothetical protein Slin14017_G106760 [Septoria linicola]USW57527.1 hypothetical protein Slin15195_G108460 [Septoria linicola]